MLKPALAMDLRTTLYPADSDVAEANARLAQTSITQPALFTIEYAMSKLWMSWGVQPQAVLGHSIGEYVAACVAGVFSLEDGLALVAERGRLIQDLPPGAMLAVRLPEKETLEYLDEELSLSTINSPLSCVVSGPSPAVERLEKRLADDDVDARQLHTSHAFHSSIMDPIIETFGERVERIRCTPPTIPFLSNLSGTWIDPNEATSPEYWTKHLRRTVRFSDSVSELLRDPNRVLLEVGPGRTLVSLVRQHQPLPPDLVLLSSLRHPREQRSDVEFLLTELGRLWLAGVDVDWTAFHSLGARSRISLPTYPFERQRHWVTPILPPRGVPAWQAGLSQTGNSATAESDAEPVDEELPSPQQGSPVRTSTTGKSQPGQDSPLPGTDVQRRLADIWRHLLGVPEIHIDDNYFELGGDSVLAVRMFTRIDKEFGKKIPLATLLDKPTIGELASTVEEDGEETSWSSLVPLNTSGSRPPVFLMHSHGGNVLEYYPLAHRLGAGQPVYALQSRGLDGTPICEPTVEEMASFYIEEIRSVQPRGPYCLGGFCFGGLLALEAAQRLRAAGESVALLVLINAAGPGYPKLKPEVTRTRRLLYAIGYRFQLECAYMKGKSWRGKSLHLGGRCLRAWDLALATAQTRLDALLARCNRRLPKHTMIYHLEQLAAAYDRAWMQYNPQPYDGRVLFFRARRQRFGICDDPLLGWNGLLTGELGQHDVPGFRQTMLDEACVETMADIVKKNLDRAHGR